MKIKTFEIRIDPMSRERDERIVNDFLARVEVTRLHYGCLRGRNSWTLIVVYDDTAQARPESQRLTVSELLPPVPDLSEQECERYEALRRWRNERAADMGRKPFVIASNRDLLNMARGRIGCPEDLLAIAGFGPRRMERYGEEIVAVLDSVE